MKKGAIYIALFLAIFYSCKSSKRIKKLVYCKMCNENILLGEINRNDLLTDDFISWYTDNYNNLKLDSSNISTIKNNISANDAIIVVLGTWCIDSKREIPHLFKILDTVGFDYKKINIIAVDLGKKAGNIDIKNLDIIRIPTIIYMRDNNEIGRIIEKPVVSLEEDLISFITKN